jgi:hypothetical protein
LAGILCISTGLTLIGVPGDSNRLERGFALFFRSFVLLLSGYVLFHKTFPFDLLEMRLLEMTGADFLLLYCRSAIATVAGLYLAGKAFVQPALPERDRVFCERWGGLGLGIALIIACSIAMRFVQDEGIIVRTAKLVARAVLWLLF